jgi:hypothetical protein
MKRALLAALALAAGCPRLPPPPPHPSVEVEQLELATASEVQLRARLRVHNHGTARLTVSAVDWELVLGPRSLLRGRSEQRRALGPDPRAIAIDLAVAIPAGLAGELRARPGLRLRGTVHLQDAAGRGHPVPFDEPARR